jgi:hypothetical protein
VFGRSNSYFCLQSLALRHVPRPQDTELQEALRSQTQLDDTNVRFQRYIEALGLSGTGKTRAVVDAVRASIDTDTHVTATFIRLNETYEVPMAEATAAEGFRSLSNVLCDLASQDEKVLQRSTQNKHRSNTHTHTYMCSVRVLC